eukprot:TRINITY_DN13427_c0_g1_i6.p1 TRINITY_DN13427_c0_g1~~TRINITY_DN13427_c0_g1_i6.p1  ORF type:complete len:381 (-),score=57.67 TRINITY_DN13427_c0_g1_i6:330-1472(-)
MKSTPSKLSLNSFKTARTIKGLYTARNMHKETSNFFVSQKANINYQTTKNSSSGSYKAFTIKKFPVPRPSPSNSNYPRMITLLNDVLPSDSTNPIPEYKRTQSESKILTPIRGSPLDKGKRRRKVLSPVIPERIEDEAKIIIKSTQKIFLAKPKDETNAQKTYTSLVEQYLKEFAKDRRRPPAVNYSQLVRSISWKVSELNDPKARHEMIKKRLRGKTDVVIWKIEEAIKRADQQHSLWVKETREADDPLGLESVKVSPRKRWEGKVKGKVCVPSVKASKILLAFQQRVKRCLETIEGGYNMPVKKWLKIAAIPMSPLTKRLSKEFFYVARSIKEFQVLLNQDVSLVYEMNAVLCTANNRCTKQDFTLPLRTTTWLWPVS